jgi:phosphoribosylformimino-5-aminoimidazole carboxamide ribotide isomerase
MRVIGVLDLRHGLAVHAREGRRDAYAPVTSIAGAAIPAGYALELARTYRDHFGITELYVADLDAILDRKAAQPQRAECEVRPIPSNIQRTDGGWPVTAHAALITDIAGTGSSVWVDAGVSTVEHARHVRQRGASRVIVGLETLDSYHALEAICSTVGGDRIAFSLDLRDGQPILASGDIQRDAPAVMAARAVQAGAGAVIVIDLARVGASGGPDLETIAGVREAVPGIELVAGGGVRGRQDLLALAGAGCDAALVATALHDGRLRPADVREPIDQRSSSR